MAGDLSSLSLADRWRTGDSRSVQQRIYLPSLQQPLHATQQPRHATQPSHAAIPQLSGLHYRNHQGRPIHTHVENGGT